MDVGGDTHQRAQRRSAAAAAAAAAAKCDSSVLSLLTSLGVGVGVLRAHAAAVRGSGPVQVHSEVKEAASSVEATVQILLKSSADLCSSQASPALLLDLQWLLGRLLLSEPPSDICSTALWPLLSLCTRWAAASYPARETLTRSGSLLASLTQYLLLTLSPGANEKSVKVLELMAYLLTGRKGLRMEAQMQGMVVKMAQWYQNHSSETVRSWCLCILAIICDGNREPSKFLLSSLSEEDRKTLLSHKVEDDIKTRTLLLCLNYSLSTTTLTPISESDGDNTSSNLEQICEAFCAAYAEENILHLKLFVALLQKVVVGPDGGKKSLDETLVDTLIKQPLLGAEFGPGCNSAANEVLFSLIHEMFLCHPNPSNIYECILKSVDLCLENISSSCTALTPTLVVKDCAVWLQNNQESLLLQNARLQVEPLIGLLADLLQSSPPKDDASLSSKCAIVETLMELGGVADWIELVAASLKPAKLLQLVETILEEVTEDRLVLAADVVLLTKQLREANESWRKTCGVLLQLPDFHERLLQRVKSPLCDAAENSKLLAVLASTQRFTSRPPGRTGTTPSLYSSNYDPCIPFEAEQSVQQSYRMLKERLSSLNEESLLGDVLDLGDVRVANLQRRLDNVTSSLRLADQRVASEMEEKQSLEWELNKLLALQRRMGQQCQAAEDEASSFRLQFENLKKDAAEFKKQKTKESAEKDAELSRLSSEAEKLTSKMTKYKENNETLKEALLEHQKVQQDLQAKLKNEVKINAELSQTLEKRDEKLRKRERQFEEEQSKREQAEAELESARKELASLHMLTKRQEAAIAKKDKLLSEQTEELAETKKIQQAIFNLSKQNAK